ncbi:MAG: hypothetical protein GY847_29905 [Proteobacteria bacterium]|nr:hypothetical protein [Pseudomonadota bacterium]
MHSNRFKMSPQRAAFAVVVLLIGYALMWWLYESDAPTVDDSLAEEQILKLEQLGKPNVLPKLKSLIQTAKAEPKDAPPEHPGQVKKRSLIDEITLDKSTACPGETVKATISQISGVNNPVQFSIPGRARGNPMVVSYDEPGMRTVHVVASDGVGGLDFGSIELEVLPADSPKCATASMLAVSAVVSNTADDAADIRVTSNMGGNLHYTYEFGDGETLTTKLAAVSHSYGMRDQGEPTSSFIIKVQATNTRGDEVSGRASVSFRNTHWLSSVVGSPMVPVEYNRFPERNESSYETEVTFKNIEELPIQFSKASITKDTCRDEAYITTEYPLDQLISGLNQLDSGEIMRAKLSLPLELVDGACRVVVLLEGDTIPARAGTPIGPGMERKFDTTRAQLAVEIAAPPKEGALAEAAPVAVMNQDMVDKLEKAQKILGPDQPITPEDLTRLEREGRL